VVEFLNGQALRLAMPGRCTEATSAVCRLGTIKAHLKGKAAFSPGIKVLSAFSSSDEVATIPRLQPSDKNGHMPTPFQQEYER